MIDRTFAIARDRDRYSLHTWAYWTVWLDTAGWYDHVLFSVCWIRMLVMIILMLMMCWENCYHMGGLNGVIWGDIVMEISIRIYVVIFRTIIMAQWHCNCCLQYERVLYLAATSAIVWRWTCSSSPRPPLLFVSGSRQAHISALLLINMECEWILKRVFD